MKLEKGMYVRTKKGIGKINEKIIGMRGQGFSYEQYKPYLLEQQKILNEVEHD